ncbi:PREDICTED: cysteine-rich receptor-like protein kinase 14 [Camelina sativa]|uniref:Cysteine-rich receptor-like protein kinase 14 n=1 Tax=Camelina sativa TaxID=90675 RepID=A0ABM0UCM8_CAMSA|nr:PREDICTED: cysteine-rich receptor-like protein kinase 14 [Camelina sativa]
MKQRNSHSILCFIILISSVSAEQCINTGTFRLNSLYDANRRLILSSLPSSVMAQDRFFVKGSTGQVPNRVYARAMCIPGSTKDDCSDCIKTASNGLIQSCPNQTGAFTWRVEPTVCHVGYSNNSFSDLYPTNVVNNNTGDINSNLTEFTAVWENLTAHMIVAASTERETALSSNKYYKADAAALTPSQNIYALMQCVPDLTSLSHDCENCLKQNVAEYQSCCRQKQGGVLMRASCFFHWDLKPFSKAFGNIMVTSSPPPLQHVKTFQGDIGPVKAIVVPIVAVAFIIIIILVLTARRSAVLCWRRNPYQGFDFDQPGITTVDSLQLDFKTIEAATDKFAMSNKLGQGGFGEVFKGMLPNGTEVAVKRLSKASEQGAPEFKNEVVVVAKLHHRNLVRLLGFCLEGKEKILVFEFVPNKSLDYYLFDPTKKGQLDWTKRYNIIRGITRGVLYLHQDSRLTIIHRDLKAGNILLDVDMNPKVADFGMARIFGIDQSGANTKRIAGTRGYMPPEYLMHGRFSTKSDVYSFGVLVLEIICGRNNRFVHQSDTTVENLVTYAWRLWRNKSLLDLVDPTISDNCQTEEVTRCIHIALLCVQHNPTDRPSLSTIHMMLTHNSLQLPDPQQPGFFYPNRRNQERDGLESIQSMNRVISHTINDVTVTDLDPR